MSETIVFVYKAEYFGRTEFRISDSFLYLVSTLCRKFGLGKQPIKLYFHSLFSHAAAILDPPLNCNPYCVILMVAVAMEQTSAQGPI